MNDNKTKDNFMALLERIQMYQRMCTGAEYFTVRLAVNEDHTAYELTVCYADAEREAFSWTFSTDFTESCNARILADMSRILKEGGWL